MNFKITALTASLFVFSVSTSALAAEGLTGCAAKQHEVEQQIEQAKKYNNTHRVAGLEKALQEIKDGCNDDTLKAQREQDIAEKKAKVAERKQELQEAQADGRSDKVAKKQKKLDEALEELKEAEAELLR